MEEPSEKTKKAEREVKKVRRMYHLAQSNEASMQRSDVVCFNTSLRRASFGCIYSASDRVERAISVAFVRPSVAYIANNSRTQRHSVLKFGMKVPILDATRTPVSRSNGQRSGLQTGGAYRVGRT